MESKKMIIIAVVAVVAIGAIGGGIALALGGGSNGEVTYTLTYETNGGAEIEKKVFTKDTETFDLTTPTRDGYNFLGWFDNDKFTGSAITQIVKGTEKDITVYAKWQLVLVANTVPTAAQMIANTDVKVTFNDSATVDQKDIGADVFNAMDAGKALTVVNTDNTGKETFSWTFNGAATTQDGYSGATVSTNVTANTDALNTDKKIVLDFDYDGKLPYESTIRYYIGGSFAAGTLISVQNEGDAQPIGQYPVDNEGYITFTINHCSDWVLTQYMQITLNANGGVFDDGSRTYVLGGKYNSDVPQAPAPTRTGYQFTPWVLPAKFTEDDTINAVWTPITYTISFNANNGTGLSSQAVTYDDNNDTFPAASAFTRNGYTCIGFNTAADGSGTFYEVGSAVPNLSSTQNAEITLYAQWRANTYTVTFNASGGDVTTATKNVTFDSAYGELPTPTRNGYNFVTWNTQNDLEGTDVTAQTIYAVAGESTLYAKWEIIHYTITYNNMDGATNSQSNPASFTVNDSFPLAAAQKQGSAFNGWFDNAAGTGTEITQISLGTHSDIQLYAKWGKNNISVTFLKDGLAMSFNDTVTVYRNDSATMTKLSDGRYYLETSDNFPIENTTYTIKRGETSVGEVEVSNGRGTLTVNYFSVTFMNDAGPEEVRVVLDGETVGEKADPSKTGYQFNEWHVNTVDGDIFQLSSQVRSTKILVPKFTALTFTVTFATGGGSAVSQITATYDSVLQYITPPTREGYNFGGFYYGEQSNLYINKNGNGVKSWDRTQNTELVPIWTEKKCTATISLGDGNVSMEQVGQGWDYVSQSNSFTKEFDFGTAISAIIADFAATPSRDFYDFNEWSPNSGTIGVNGVDINAAYVETSYTFSFNTNSGTGNVSSIQNVHIGDTIDEPAYDGTRTGFNFANAWCYDDDGNTAVFSNGSITLNAYNMTSLDINENNVITVYAKWTPNYYTITFNGNQGVGDPPSDMTNKKIGDTISMPSTSVTKQGKFFGGWNTSADGTGTNYTGNVTIDENFIGNAVGTTVTLYIKWTDGPYTATLGDRFEGKIYDYDQSGDLQNTTNFKALVIRVYDNLYDVEMLIEVQGQWISDGFMTCSQGRYPPLYGCSQEVADLIHSGTTGGDQISIVINGQRHYYNVTVYNKGLNNNTYISYEDQYDTCYAYEATTQYPDAQGNIIYSHTRMELETIVQGNGNGYNPGTAFNVTYYSRQGQNATSQTVSSSTYKTPAQLGFEAPNGMEFAGWTLEDTAPQYGYDEDDYAEMFNSNQIVISTRSVYAVWKEIIIPPTNIDWVVHNLPNGITLEINDSDAFESNGTSGQHVVFNGGNNWSKVVNDGKNIYTFRINGVTYHAQIKVPNDGKISDNPDGNVMRITFGDAGQGRYSIEIYFWMDMPELPGYLPTENDTFVYNDSGDYTFVITDVIGGGYSTRNTVFNDYMYPTDTGGRMKYFNTIDPDDYLTRNMSFVYVEGRYDGHDCYIIKDHVYSRQLSNDRTVITDEDIRVGYYGMNNGLLYMMDDGLFQFTLSSGPEDHIALKYPALLDANGGTFSPGDTYLLDKDYELDSYEPLFNDHRFVKWTTNRDGTGRVYEAGDRFNPEDVDNQGRVVLYAQWMINGFYIHMTATDGTPSSSTIDVLYRNMSYGSQYYLPYDFPSITPPNNKACCGFLFEDIETPYRSFTVDMRNYDMVAVGDGTFTNNGFLNHVFHKVAGKEVYYSTDFGHLQIIVEYGETIEVAMVWTEDIVSITYHSNTAQDSTVTINFADGDGFIGRMPSENLFNNPGYVFICWSTVSNIDLVDNENSYPANYPIENWIPTTYYAIWAPYMTISYHPSGATGNIDDYVLDIMNTQYYLNNGNAYSKQGFEFMGWSTTQGSSVITYLGNYNYVMDEGQAGETLNLYAVWSVGTYVVMFDKNAPVDHEDPEESADIDGEMSNQLIGVGTTIALRLNAFTDNDGYYGFAGWATSPSGEVVYGNGEQVADLCGVSGTITLYAKWERISYRLVFYDNGGTGVMEPIDRLAGDEVPLPDCTFTPPAGKVFSCWRVDDQEDGVDLDAGYTGDVTHEHNSAPKLFAIWVDE